MQHTPMIVTVLSQVLSRRLRGGIVVEFKHHVRFTFLVAHPFWPGRVGLGTESSLRERRIFDPTDQSDFRYRRKRSVEPVNGTFNLLRPQEVQARGQGDSGSKALLHETP
jgi:hypothetical protein